jgi:serine protease
MRSSVLASLMLAGALLAPSTAPTSHAQGVAPGTTMTAPKARVIVKLRADSPLLRAQALSASAPRAGRAEAMGRRVGLALRAGIDVDERSQVMLADGIDSAQLAQRLAAEADVEYAVPDRRRHRMAAPNDPLYLAGPPVVGTSGGPVVGQWYLRAPVDPVKSSLDAEAAWAVTTGSSAIVVAVLDTGVRFDHPDLRRAAQGGPLLAGYDMISDVDVANDGNGRDADPSDPGDWVSQNDITSNPGSFGPCSVEPTSSWHGTQVSGIIAASTHNGIGMAGIGRNVRILPVRVLGKCGGFDSDIIAGIKWAAGLSVPGVPANPNPARVINLSLGSVDNCDATNPNAVPYREAFSAVAAVGTVVISSAGNSAGHPVATPANCPGVIAVAALRHVGTKVGFSDIGPEIAISAPGGNCINVGEGEPCLYPILTTTNSGVTMPTIGLGGSIYTDAFNASLGTSFSSPLVAGTAALMLAAQPSLTPAEVRSLLQATARSFPTTGGDNGVGGDPVTECVAPQAGVDQFQCYCTTSTCGAGMLDAGAALRAVLASAGIVANITVTTSTPTANQPVLLSAAATAIAPGGAAIASYLWEISSDGGGIVTAFGSATNASTASITPIAGGLFSVRLTVQDTLGHSSSTQASVVVSGAALPPPPPPPAESSGGGGALGIAWLALLLCAVLALCLVPPRSAARKR